MWRYPKELFGRYRSASLHIKRRRTPRVVWVLVGGVALILFAGWTLYGSIMSRLDGEREEVAEQGVPTSETSPPLSSQGIAQNIFGPPVAQPVTAEQWLHAHVPLVEGAPWSAPIFAGRQPMTNPDLFCVVIGEFDSWRSECRCYSEQATRIHVSASICLKAARDGVYNPYRGAATMQAGSSPASPGAGASATTAPGGAGVRPVDSSLAPR